MTGHPVGKATPINFMSGFVAQVRLHEPGKSNSNWIFFFLLTLFSLCLNPAQYFRRTSQNIQCAQLKCPHCQPIPASEIPHGLSGNQSINS